MKRRSFHNSIGQRLALPWGIFPPEMKAIHARYRARLKAQLDDDNEEELADTDNGPQVIERPASNIAVIPIHGVIGKHLSFFEKLFFGGCDLCDVDDMLDAARQDESIGTAIIDVRSPGGICIGVKETCEKIDDLKAAGKRVLSFSDYMACSNGYRLAMHAAEVYAAPSAIMGNVGTIRSVEDITKMLEMMGVKIEIFVAGEYKDIGYDGASLTDKQRAFLNEELQAADKDFKDDVRANRPQIAATYLEGQWYSGDRAMPLGFVDGIMNSLDDLVAKLLGHDAMVAKGY